jgi:hypothetical protein
MVNYSTFTYNFDFNLAQASLWRENYDSSNWICSGQGQSDISVTLSNSNSHHAYVCSGLNDQFLIAWQDYRLNKNILNINNGTDQIWYSIYDGTEDVLWSSGQNKFDYFIGSNIYNPKITLDSAGTFNLIGYYNTGLYYYVGPVNDNTMLIGNTYWNDNYFVPDNLISLSADSSPFAYINDNYIKNFIAFSNDKALPLVTDTLLKVRIDNVKNAYALR